MDRQKILILLVSLILASCQYGVADISQSLTHVELSKIPEGQFTGIAWVHPDTLLLEIDKGNLFINQRMCVQETLNIYEFETNQLQQLLIPFGGECNSYVMRSLQVLPNQEAGYVFEYPKLNSVIIKSVNLRTATETDLYTEPALNTSLDTFSYSPDMTQLLLVDTQSTMMKSAIYLLNASGERVNITTDFLRADFPVWSKKNNLIAFFGTKPYPGSNDKIEHFSELEARVDYPWWVYVYNPEQRTIKELSFEVVHPSSLKWSPDGKMLAFSGEHHGRHGVWINNGFATDNATITRVIDGRATFDFSPDSRSIAYAYIGLLNTEKQNIVYMVNLKEAD